MEWKPEDYIVTHVDVNLSWLDRIKIFFNGNVCMRVDTACEIAPGRVSSETSVWTPPLIRRKSAGGYAEISR